MPKLIRSLRTKNPQQACKLASCLAERLDNHWAGLRNDTLSAFFCGQQATPPADIIPHCVITMLDALTGYLRHKGRGKGESFVLQQTGFCASISIAAANQCATLLVWSRQYLNGIIGSNSQLKQELYDIDSLISF